MVKIKEILVFDVRFPTSLEGHGSDAMHSDPDYSMAYVTILTESPNLKGYGLVFTLGRGTEIVLKAMEAYIPFFVGLNLDQITSQFGCFYHKLANESQLRWLGPEKGVVHLALSGLLNAVWDLWARSENKPLWKLLCDMDIEKVLDCIDFTYIEDVVDRNQAKELLSSSQGVQSDREKWLAQHGFPAYTTSAGWLGYSDEEVRRLCQQSLESGFQSFKVKVGDNVDKDQQRLRLIREIIGFDRRLMIDANQKWSVNQAKQWMQALLESKPYWIEEPTSCDDVLGHAEISRALNPHGVLVVSGEHCQNRVLFKQFLQSGAIQVCQVDACRLGGVNEVLAVLLMARHFDVPVCPHAGGVGLCHLVQHLVVFDFVRLTGTVEHRMCEYAGHLHEHFEERLDFSDGFYRLPRHVGYTPTLKSSSLAEFQFPTGSFWSERSAQI